MNAIYGRRLAQALALALVLCLAAPLAAAQAGADKAPDYFYKNIVDFEFVKNYVKMPKLEGVEIIDSRPYLGKHAKGYIPTSISIPDTEFEKKADLLPKDKKALLIFYCEGPTCKLSHSSARKAEKLGYSNVVVYPGGYPDWIAHEGVYESVGTEYVREKLEKGEPMVLIDARPLSKFLEGAIPGSLSIPDSVGDTRMGLLPADKKSEIVYYCGGFDCKLSHTSAIRAKKAGYASVKVYEAGYPAWTEKYGAAQKVEVKSGGADGVMDTAQFQKIMAENPGSILVVDVRDADEFAAGHVPGAVNIPVGQLEKRIGELPSDKPVVFVCNTGARSGEAYYMVLDKKPDMKNAFYLDANVKYAKDNTYTIVPAKK